MPAAPHALTPLRSAFVVGGWRLDGSVFVLNNRVWFWSAVIAVTAWYLVRHHGIGRPA